MKGVAAALFHDKVIRFIVFDLSMSFSLSQRVKNSWCLQTLSCLFRYDPDQNYAEEKLSLLFFIAFR